MDEIFKLIYEFRAENFYAVLNSQFASSVVGALLGAFAGAFAAHRIASNAKRREEIEIQIRSVNVAISSAFLICNSILGLKSQHVDSLYKKYMANRKSYEDTLKQPPAGVVVHFDIDLKTLQMPHIPIEVLEKTAYEKVTLNGRPLALISTIANSIDTLRSSLNLRNNLISTFKDLFPTIPEKNKFDYYFGFPLPDGSVNQEYLDSIEAIYQYTDDVIFFCSLLCDDLKKYGEDVREAYRKRYRKKVDKITGFDFKTAKAVAIWPNEDNYKEWLGMFVAKQEELSWYRRIFATNKPSKKDASEAGASS